MWSSVKPQIIQFAHENFKDDGKNALLNACFVLRKINNESTEISETSDGTTCNFVRHLERVHPDDKDHITACHFYIHFGLDKKL